MTTMTKTMRKAPWAAALTALLAVLALVFGVLTIAAPAGADPPDSPGNSAEAPGQNKDDDGSPGNSENAPGQNQTPPGQADKDEGDDYNPGASHDKMTICHYVEGKGETKAGYNIITMSVQAWEAHKAHHPDTMDVVYNGVSCPTVNPTPASLCNLTLDPPAMQPFADNTSTEYLAALADANGAQTTWALTCPTGPGPNPVDHSATLCNLTTVPPDYYTWTWQDEAVPEGYTTALADANGAQTTWALTCPGGGSEEGEATAVTAPEAATVEQPTPVTAVEAGTVEQPAKVTLPATVTVPAPATVPAVATVPAGDGSSVPTVPVYALALLALGAMTLAASTVRLVKAPTS